MVGGDGRWWKRSLAHIHVGFFKGGKPEVSAGGEDAFKARIAIHKRSHWRWKLRIRYRHTSIRKSATPKTRKNTRWRRNQGKYFSPMCRRSRVTSRTTIFQHFSFPQRALGFLTFHQILLFCYSLFVLNSIERNVIQKFRSI